MDTVGWPLVGAVGGVGGQWGILSTFSGFRPATRPQPWFWNTPGPEGESAPSNYGWGVDIPDRASGGDRLGRLGHSNNPQLTPTDGQPTPTNPQPTAN